LSHARKLARKLPTTWRPLPRRHNIERTLPCNWLCGAKGDRDLEELMSTLVGFGTFAALLEEQISENSETSPQLTELPSGRPARASCLDVRYTGGVFAA
jgi:hypothetical protein